MYVHYYLDSSLKVVKITGSLKNLAAPPKLSLGYTVGECDAELANQVNKLISSNNINSAEFSNETPIYNLGFFEQKSEKRKSFYKLLQLSGANESGILYLIEYSNVPDVFTLDEVDKDVIESIEISRFRDIMKVSSIGVLQIDDQWRTLYASKTWSEMTGYNLTEVVGRDWVNILHPEDKSIFLDILHEHAQVEKNSEQDVRIMTPHGSYIWFNVHYRISYDQLNNCSSVILLFLDIHNKRQSQEHLQQIATTDLLTRLSNRYAFQESLEQHVRQLHPVHSFYLLFIDLDGFKAVNDAYGHVIGDKLLAETARRILSVTGQYSTVARLGGDEFAILQTFSSSPDIDAYATRLLKEISRPYYLIEHAEESYISASVGIVSVNPSDMAYADTLDEDKVTKKCSQLLSEADTAMYHAKDDGKNTYRLYAGSINEQARKTQLLIDSLHRALEGNEFELYYQPQWNISTGEIYGYEALIRWKKNGSYIDPSLFIPLVESNGLMSEMGKWIFEKAISDHAKLLDDSGAMHQLSVNFSAIQFRDHNLYRFIEATLQKYSIPAETVTIEITESLLISDHIEVKKQLERLKEVGLKIALDDFGTGYSSLSMLHNFPIDIIKVDRSFTQNLALHDTRKIVRAIIKMSNELNKTILFEGIESEQQLTILKKEGVDIIQGWLISKAIPLEEMASFTQTKTKEVVYS